jgi:valyl-tRNA synthetase
MGIENTGQVPFRTVFLHGLIRDATGAKMSKTRGNTMDPLELIDQYGTDALRFALTTGTAPGNDLRFGENRLEAARNFANKVWNASRFVISGLEGKCGLDGWHDVSNIEHREDRWIVSRLDRVTYGVNESLRNFELGDAQQKLYDFFWNDYCDWYIEMAKLRLRAGDGPSPLPVLSHVLERTLRLLHPFMPFITEEVWQNLRSKLPLEGTNVESVMVSEYPSADCPREDVKAEQEIGMIMQLVRAIRNARAQLRIPAAQHLEAKIEVNEMQSLIEEEAEVIRVLSRVDPLHITNRDSADLDLLKGITLVVNPLVIHLPLEGVVDISAEEQRLRAELDDCLKNMNRVDQLVSNSNFLEKAKPEVVESEHARLQDLKERRQHLNEILDQLTS